MSSKLQLDVVTTVRGGAIWWTQMTAKGRHVVVCRLNCVIHVWAPWGLHTCHLGRYINPRTFTFTFYFCYSFYYKHYHHHHVDDDNDDGKDNNIKDLHSHRLLLMCTTTSANKFLIWFWLDLYPVSVQSYIPHAKILQFIVGGLTTNRRILPCGMPNITRLTITCHSSHIHAKRSSVFAAWYHA